MFQGTVSVFSRGVVFTDPNFVVFSIFASTFYECMDGGFVVCKMKVRNIPRLWLEVN